MSTAASYSSSRLLKFAAGRAASSSSFVLSCISSPANCGASMPTKSTTRVISSSERYVPWPRSSVLVPGEQEQHVAVAEQLVGAHFVEHDAAIGAAGDLERDAGRQVRLDQAGDDVDRRLLRGEDQVDADRPALLGEADDVLLDVLAGGHHEVGHLVGDDHDERQIAAESASHSSSLSGSNAIAQLVVAELVVDAQVPHAGPRAGAGNAPPSCRRPRPGSPRPCACR